MSDLKYVLFSDFYVKLVGHWIHFMKDMTDILQNPKMNSDKILKILSGHLHLNTIPDRLVQTINEIRKQSPSCFQIRSRETGHQLRYPELYYTLKSEPHLLFRRLCVFTDSDGK